MTPMDGGRPGTGRFRALAPHRQIYLLCVISLVTLGIVVVAVLAALGPTRRSLSSSTQTLIPAAEKLDEARERYNATAGAFRDAASADAASRGAVFDRLTQLNSEGSAAWKAYERIAVGLPGEVGLRQRFLAHRKAALAAGVAFLSQDAVTAEELAGVTQFVEAMRVDLNDLRGLYEARIQESVRESRDQITSVQQVVVWVALGAVVVLLISFGLASRGARSRERLAAKLDRALHADAERNELETRVQRALEMVPNEAATYSLVDRALRSAAPELPAEFLLADSSRAHFRQVGCTDEHGLPGCPVMSPGDCPATARGQTQVWDSSGALDACPSLHHRPSGECSAVCVPLSIGGNTVGVLHATAADHEPPAEPTIDKLELIARRTGERIGMLRAFERSETQAHTDPLTGLMNRRSLEEQVREMSAEARSYVAAYGDLDHFKQLNDVYGRDAGDRALRLFARVLRDSVRPNDLAARYGGEEFVVVLPNCPMPDANAVIARLREGLATAQQGTTVPPFTVSFGLAASRPERTFSETLEVADAALLDAKATGRDRVVVAEGSGVTDLERVLQARPAG